MALQGGMSNLGISIVTLDGAKYVERAYEVGTLNAVDFWVHLDLAFKTGLTPSAAWRFKERPDAQYVANPFSQIVEVCSVEKEVVWDAYERLLVKLETLYKEHNTIVSDAHSLNLRLCKVGDDSYDVLLLDGKLGGMTQTPSTRRLYVKLKYETLPEHRWFLWEYIGFLQANGVQ